MLQLIAWAIGIVTMIATPLAALLLIVGLVLGAIAYGSGKRQDASAWWVGGLVSAGVLLFTPAIVAAINAVPKSA